MYQKDKAIQDEGEYVPSFFRLRNPAEKRTFENLFFKKGHAITVYDALESQLYELMKIIHPTQRLRESESKKLIAEHLGSVAMMEYGVWVYYPWANHMVHMLDEEEFIAVRTNRNIFKVQPHEVALLRKKVIGIIGLSVGQSIALTLAMESTCGELRLADPDRIELSNLNRMKAGIHELGMNKAIVAARQIAALDPFIKITCFSEGINERNMEAFILEDSQLDILVEECDSIDIKILTRFLAKKFRIPVVMDTNDKGMLDVERFDLEPNRPIFHGRLDELERAGMAASMKKMAEMSFEEKISCLAQIIGMENVSDAMKFSLSQMNKTIVGWPQLASAVALGGAMVTDACRKILLKQYTSSGRIFLDLNQYIND